MTEITQHQEIAKENSTPQSGDGTSVLSPMHNNALYPAIDSASDNDASERPVREKLKKTSIASISKAVTNPLQNNSSVTWGTIDVPPDPTSDISRKNQDAIKENTEPRGRSQRKRSFDDLEAQEETSGARSPKGHNGHHSRKRSRDVGVGQDTEDDQNHKAPDQNLMDNDMEDEVDAADNQMGQIGERQADEATKDLSRSSLQDNENLEMKYSAFSPRKKRSRDQLDIETHREQKIPATEEAKAHRRSEESEREGLLYDGKVEEHVKVQPLQQQKLNSVHQDCKDRDELPTADAKVNRSNSTSPSPGVVKPLPTPESRDLTDQLTQAPATNFASSGFAALSGSSSSPFGTLGASSSTGASPFASLGQSNAQSPGGMKLGANEVNVAANTPFASTATSMPTKFSATKPLGLDNIRTSNPGTFGGTAFGSGFGSAFGAAPKLTSFATSTGDTKWGGGTGEVKQFGAPAQEAGDDEGSGSDNEGQSQSFDDNDEADARFQQQGVETGEDGEETVFSAPRAALFRFDGASWKEGGRGTFKLNATSQSTEDSGEALRTGRFIMRAHQTYRVILNEPLYKEMLVGDAKGNEPKSRSFAFAVIEKGKAVPHMIRLSDDAESKMLYREVHRLQQAM